MVHSLFSVASLRLLQQVCRSLQVLPLLNVASPTVMLPSLKLTPESANAQLSLLKQLEEQLASSVWQVLHAAGCSQAVKHVLSPQPHLLVHSSQVLQAPPGVPWA